MNDEYLRLFKSKLALSATSRYVKPDEDFKAWLSSDDERLDRFVLDERICSVNYVDDPVHHTLARRIVQQIGLAMYQLHKPFRSRVDESLAMSHACNAVNYVQDLNYLVSSGAIQL